MRRNTFKILIALILGLLVSPVFSQNPDFGRTVNPVGDCESKFGTGEDSIACITNISLYRESFKNWKSSKNVQYMIDAYSYWRLAMFGCPCATKNIYIDGEKMLTHIIGNPGDQLVKGYWYMVPDMSVAEMKARYVDTLMFLYDRRIEAFQQPCYVQSKKGVSLMTYAPERYEDAYTALNNSVNCRQEKASPRELFEYFESTVAMVKNGKMDTTDMLDVYDQVTSYCIANKDSRNGAIYGLTLEEIEKTGESFLTCEVIVPAYKTKFAANKDNLVFLRKTVKMLDKQGCTDNPVFHKAARQLYDLSPDSSAALALAKMEHSLQNYSSCITYLKDATQAFKSPASLEDAYLLMADAYSRLGNMGESRSAAMKVLDINPNNGKAYIVIGDLYYNSASSCTYKQLVTSYWVAADTYAKAKSVDPSVADEADNKIAASKSRFPSKEKIFYAALNIGDSYTVNCWINRTTTVRSSD